MYFSNPNPQPKDLNWINLVKLLTLVEMGQLFEVIKLFLILFEHRVSNNRVLWRQGINWLNYNKLGRYNTIQTIRKLFDSIANTYQSLEVSWGLLIKFIICSWSFTLRSPFSPFSILPENKITIDSDCFRLFIKKNFRCGVKGYLKMSFSSSRSYSLTERLFVLILWKLCSCSFNVFLMHGRK